MSGSDMEELEREQMRDERDSVRTDSIESIATSLAVIAARLGTLTQIEALAASFQHGEKFMECLERLKAKEGST